MGSAMAFGSPPGPVTNSSFAAGLRPARGKGTWQRRGRGAGALPQTGAYDGVVVARDGFHPVPLDISAVLRPHVAIRNQALSGARRRRILVEDDVRLFVARKMRGDVLLPLTVRAVDLSAQRRTYVVVPQTDVGSARVVEGASPAPSRGNEGC
jgi:hypothetical protein